MASLLPTAVLLLLPSAALPQAAQQPVRTQHVEDLVNIDFRNDLRLFTVMCALNAAGFDAESVDSTTGGPRAELQSYFAQLSPDLLEPLRKYLASQPFTTPSEIQAAFTSLALMLGGPPGFELAVPEDQLPEDALQLTGLIPLLGPFWEGARIGRLWQIYEPRYVHELEAYRPVVREVIRETLDYFRIEARIVLDRQILLIPDLLNLQGVVNARNLDRSYTIIVGPTSDPSSNRRQLQHEYLHFLIDPLAEKFGAEALENRSLLEIAHEQPSIRPDYRDRFLLIVGESLIEAIQLRLESPGASQESTIEPFRRGLILVPHFLRQLERFEESSVSLPEAVSDMFAAISESDVRSDVAAISALESELENARSAEQQRVEEQRGAVELHNRRAALLNEAGRLMESGELDEATDRLQSLLQLEPASGEAEFYLGQIATRRKQHDEAFEHYRRAAASDGVAVSVRAWALVRMGLYLAAQGDFVQARARFEEAAGLEGDLGGARQEAEARLQQLPPAGSTSGG